MLLERFSSSVSGSSLLSSTKPRQVPTFLSPLEIGAGRKLEDDRV